MKLIANGFIRKMSHKNISPVNYFFSTFNFEKNSKKIIESQSEVSLNSVLGKKIKFVFNAQRRCVDCGNSIKSDSSSNSCYSCFTKLASNDFCVLQPVKCHFHLGTCREPDWGEKNCFKEHAVYLTFTSNLKVGITKEKPVTNRWVDQGAISGVEICKVDSRRDAGILEKIISEKMSDKSNWKEMLQSSINNKIDLIQEKEKILTEINFQFLEIDSIPNISSELISIEYPILAEEFKIKRIEISSEPVEINDQLLGIKGQYMLFSDGVINIRSLEGRHVEFSVEL